MSLLFTLTGLSVACAVGSPTRAFTVTLDAAPESALTVALSDDGAGGYFFPSALDFTPSGSLIRQFVYIPYAGNSVTITASADGSSHSVTLPFAPASQAFFDDFNGPSGMNLVEHGGWSKRWWNGERNAVLNGAGAVRASDAEAEYVASASPGADTDVAATLKVFDRGTNGVVSLAVRLNSTATLLSGYMLGYYDNTFGWFFQRTISNAGVHLIPGGSLTHQPLDGGETRIAVRWIDGKQWFFLLYDGELIVPPINDDSLTGGDSGIFPLVQNGTPADGAGIQFDTFVIENADWALVVVPSEFSFPNENLFQSPGVWRNEDGSAIAALTGYLKGRFSGSATLKLKVDSSINAGLAADWMPAFKVIVDQRPAVYVQVPVGATQVTLASGLDTGEHSFTIYAIGARQTAGDGWLTRTIQTKVDRLVIDGGGILLPPVTRQKRALIFTDSYGFYFGAVIAGPSYTYFDPTKSFVSALAFALGAEYGQVSLSGSGWVKDGGVYPGFPAFPSWFDHLDSSHSRDLGTLDYAVACLGINDRDQTNSAVQAAVANWLINARAALPATKIVVVIPPDGQKRAAIAAGFAASSDANMKLVDIGDELAPAIPWNGTPTWLCPDSVHIAQEYEMLLAAAIAAQSK